MKKSVCFVAGMLAGSAWAALPSNVIYRNDFTTRESAEAIPRIGETYEATPYPTKSSWLHPYLIDSPRLFQRLQQAHPHSRKQPPRERTARLPV